MAWFTPLNSSQCRVVFHIHPPNAGTISFNGNSYSNGEVTVVSNGTYSISANPNSGYQFDHWKAEGKINVTDPYSPSTTVSIEGNGVIMAWFTPHKHTFHHSIFQRLFYWSKIFGFHL